MASSPAAGTLEHCNAWEHEPLNRIYFASLLLLTLATLRSGYAGTLLEPTQFGAIGDGRVHPIGRTYGATLNSLAGHVAPGGARPFAFVLDPVYGLTFARQTLAAQDVPEAELRFASVGGPLNAATQIIMPGMIASGPCLPAADTVRSVHDTGALTLEHPTQFACPAGSRIEFALSSAQVQELTADWLGIQAAVAAAHGLPTGGAVHIPAGDYRVNRPVMNPGGVDPREMVPVVDEYGDGVAQTRIVFTVDLGPNTCGFGEADRGIGSTTRARIRDLRLIGPGVRSLMGTSPAAMDGFCIGAKELLRRVRADGFHAGANILEDHWEIQDSEFANNYYGIYLAPGGDTFGNGVLRDVFPVGNTLASIAVAASNTLNFATVQNVHLGFGPYGFYREPAPKGSAVLGDFLANNLLENVWGESIGNGYIYGANGELDRVENNIWINDEPVMDLGMTYRASKFPATALVHVGSWFNNDMVRSDFGNPNNYRMVTHALIEAAGAIQGNDFGRSADMVAGSSAAKPALSAAVLLFNRFSTGQGQGRWMTATAAVHAGELLTDAGFDRVEPASSARTQLAGVAMASAGAGDAVPVCDHGLVQVDKIQISLMRGQRVGGATDDPTHVTANTEASFATVWENAPAEASKVGVFIGTR